MRTRHSRFVGAIAFALWLATASTGSASPAFVDGRVTVAVNWFFVQDVRTSPVHDVEVEWARTVGGGDAFVALMIVDVTESGVAIRYDVEQDPPLQADRRLVRGPWVIRLSGLECGAEPACCVTDLVVVESTFISGEVTWSVTPDAIEIVQERHDDFVFTEGILEQSISLRFVTGDESPFRRGDADDDGRVGLTDAIAILETLFRGGAPFDCADSADANDDGEVNLSDAVGLLLHLFRGGEPPPAPGSSDCGEDPTPDLLPACVSECAE